MKEQQAAKENFIGETEEYAVYEITFERDEAEIYGQFYLPKGSLTAYPTVIIGHGFGSSYTATAKDAQYLAEAGIASYVFDFCGGSPSCASSGSMLDMSVLTEKADMETVLDGLVSYDFVDKENIFLMGESQGGMVAALLGSTRSEDIQGLVLFFPALVIPDDARALFQNEAEIEDQNQALGMPVGRRYYTDVLDMDVYQEISGFTKDVLIVHGNEDTLVPISYSQRAQEVYASAELKVIDKGGHGFYGEQLQEACQSAIGFIKARIESN